MDELCGGKGQWNGLIGQINCAWRRVSYPTMYKLNVAQHHTNRNSYLQHSQFERKQLHVAIMNNVYAKRWLKGNGARCWIGSP